MDVRQTGSFPAWFVSCYCDGVNPGIDMDCATYVYFSFNSTQGVYAIIVSCITTNCLVECEEGAGEGSPVCKCP